MYIKANSQLFIFCW